MNKLEQLSDASKKFEIACEQLNERIKELCQTGHARLDELAGYLGLKGGDKND